MQTGIKLLLAAVLSLSVGVAFAAPLYIADMNIKPFPRNPEGPKADTSISVVYANFSVSPGTTYSHSYNNTLSLDVTTSILNYEVVLNVTNLSNLGAQITRLGLTASHDIFAVPAVVGLMEHKANGGGGTLSTGISDDLMSGTNWGIWSHFENGTDRTGGSGLVTGVWLDGSWINVTWIPGTNYPRWPAPSGGWFPANVTSPPPGTMYDLPSLSDTWPTTKVVPSLPENASTEGMWVEGVPIIEMHTVTTAPDKTTTVTTVTGIFINGTWVDVTGRVRAAHEGLYIRATGIIAAEKRFFETEPLSNFTDHSSNSTYPWQSDKAWMPVRTYTKTGEGEFDNYWAPHQSRLIMLKGTREMLPNQGLDSLATGKITLLAEEFNCVDDPSVNSTALYTFSGGHWLNQVQVQRTTNGYIYNTFMDENQMFATDQWGVEVFIKPRS